MKHDFLLIPGTWLGEGQISFTGSHDIIKFYTKWVVDDEEDGRIQCIQKVEKVDVDDDLTSFYRLSEITEKNFVMDLDNELVGKVKGKGVITESSVGWEFPSESGCEGFEIYHVQPNGEYTLHAEFMSGQFRTRIDARLWKKESTDL